MSDPKSSHAPGAGASLPRWRVFPPVALGVIMATLDASVVNIALPTLQRGFAVPLTTVEWVVLGYTVTITGLLLTAGRLADKVGRRFVYGAGLVAFTLASILCGAAPSIGWLVAARIVQGAGAALVSANGSAILVSAFPAEERGKALGAFGAMVGVGLAIGAPLGGIVVAHASWRWLFLANVPLGALAFTLLRARVPRDEPAPGAPPVSLGAALAWCAALVALMLALSLGPATGWMQPRVLALFAASALLLAGFLLAQAKATAPLLPPRLLAGPLGAAVALTLMSQALSIAVGIQVPLYLEDVLGFDAQKSGMWNAILPLGALLLAPIAGRIADRRGARLPTTLGMGMTAAGFVVLAGLGLQAQPLRLLVGLGLVGAGQGLFGVPNASALLSLVPPAQLGIATGLQGTTRNLGFSSGAALMGALLASRYAHHAGRHLAGSGGAVDASAFAGATREAYGVLAAIALLAALLAARQRRPAA